MTERVVLAYSGGLDTSVAIGWIAEETGAEVIAVAGRRRPGRRGHGRHPPARPRLRRRRVDRRRRARRVRRRLLPAGAAGQRPLHGPLPAGLGAVPAADRQAPRRRRASTTAPSMVAHGCTGKGNDQVRFEVGIGALGPGPQGARAGPRLRHDPRQGDRVRRGEGPADRRRPRSRRTRSTRTSGAARSRPASSRTSGTAPIEDVYAYTAGPGRRRATPTRSSSPSTAGVPTAIDGQPVTMLQAIERAQPRAPARRASAGSTWSRTGWSASRAARSTRPPARSR